MSSSIEKNPPFKPELSVKDIVTGEFNMNAGRLHELGPNFVVRRFPIEDTPASSAESKRIRAERITQEQVADAFFRELQNYGVNVVPYRRVIGYDSVDRYQEAIYTITDRIEGKSLDNLTPKEIREYAPQIDRTFAGLFSQVKKVLNEGGIFHSDLYPTQFMAGTNVRHPEKGTDVFCVDIDPIFFAYSPHDSDEKIFTSLVRPILLAIGDIEMMIRKADISLPQTYNAAVEIVKVLKTRESNDVKEWLEEMEKYGSAIVAKGLETTT